MTSWKLLIFTIEDIEQMILLVGLELLRQGARIHTRGLLLGSAGRLEFLLNMVRAIVARERDQDCVSFADTLKVNLTAWNDEKTECPDFVRSHLMHYETTIKVGYGLQVTQKRGWNGKNLDGIKHVDREVKRRLRVIKLNEDIPTVFEKPVFNIEKGTYNLERKDVLKANDLNQPLIPRGDKKGIKTLIR